MLSLGRPGAAVPGRPISFTRLRPAGCPADRCRVTLCHSQRAQGIIVTKCSGNLISCNGLRMWSLVWSGGLELMFAIDLLHELIAGDFERQLEHGRMCDDVLHTLQESTHFLQSTPS